MNRGGAKRDKRRYSTGTGGPGIERACDAAGCGTSIASACGVRIAYSVMFIRPSVITRSPRTVSIIGGFGLLANASGTIVCGRADAHPQGVDVRSLVERFGERRAFHDTAAALQDLVAELAGGWRAG